MNQPNFIIAGNWKMNGSTQSVATLLDALGSIDTRGCEVIVFPPSVYIQQAVLALSDGPILVGAQNAHAKLSGAHTGEISAPMLADVGCTYVLAGHSERRLEAGETNSAVSIKCAAVQTAELTPILCVGEQLHEREAGNAGQVVSGQLQAVLDFIGPVAMCKILIAYEPVWAIGTGAVAKPEEIATMHSFVRQWLIDQAGKGAAYVKLLYGGSVNKDNAALILEQEHVAGALVGGASLDIESFSAIINAARELGNAL